MKHTQSLALATILAAMTLCGGTTAAPALQDPAPGAPTQPNRVRQFHGSVTRPKHICGWNMGATGQPGTRYKVYAQGANGQQQLIATGTIPTGGSISTGVSAPGCQRERHVERVRIWSVADSPISFAVSYW